MIVRVLRVATIVVIALVLPAVAAAATPPDPSKITAQCFASDSENGQFSPTNPVVLWSGAPLVVALQYRNGDANADPGYFAHFTARIADTAAFGPAHTIDTSTHFGGGPGVSTGTTHHVNLPTTGAAASERILIEITSDASSGVLATCDFNLTVQSVNADLDGDGISNDEEMHGLRDSANNLILTASGQAAGDFVALGANPCRKDLFIQLDFQTGAGHDHVPKTAALDQVRQAFSDAPLPPVVGGCPFPGYLSAGGIHLVIVQDDPLPAEVVTTNPNGTTSIVPIDCNTIPLDRFDPARRPYFLYSVWAHQSAANGQSGLGPCAQRSFIVSLGLWPDHGSVQEQAGTFMHELGHALGLGHGGGDSVNLKPNYLSVMNYSFQVTGILDAANVGHADYSRSKLPTLDEASLSEAAGVQGPAGLQTRWWGPQPAFRFMDASSPFTAAGGSLDWNQNGRIDSGTVGVDINSDGQCTGPGPDNVRDTVPAGDDVVSKNEVWDGTNRICDSRPANDDTQSPQPASACVLPGPDGTLQSAAAMDDVLGGSNIALGPNLVCDSTAAGNDVQFVAVGRTEARLFGFDDWGSIDWRIGPTRTQPGPGVSLPPVEPHSDMTERQARAIEDAANLSTQFDLEVRTSADPQDVLPGDTVTFTTSVANTGTGTATNIRLVETLPDGSAVTRLVPDLAPGGSAGETFFYTVPFPIADGRVLTATATASGQSPTGAPEAQTNNNTASASATAHSAGCSASGTGGIGATRSFVFAVRPFGPFVAGFVGYVDLAPTSRAVVTSTRMTGIACFRRHARIFGIGRAILGTPIVFRLDVDDLGAGPGTDLFSIGWPGYAASGTLTRGDVRVGA